jgi:hypothetical protein
MAFYSDNFGAYDTGAEPPSDNWIVLTGSDDEGDAVEANAEASGGQVFRLFNDNNSVPVWSPVVVPPGADFQIKMRFYPASGIVVYLWARKPSGSPHGYRLSLFDGLIILTKISSGGSSIVINTSAQSFNPDVWNIAEMSTIGDVVKVRVYAEGATIPAWLEYDDTGSPLADGFVGVTTGKGSTGECDVDYFQVSTNGELPPGTTDENGETIIDNVLNGRTYQVAVTRPGCPTQYVQVVT